MIKIKLLTVAFLALWIASAQAAPTAFVTIPPQKYFVDRISGDTVPVSIMIEPGANPHAYEPKPKQMAALTKAAIYFSIDDTFDQIWLPRLTAANPQIVLVHTAQGINKIPMRVHLHDESPAHQEIDHETDYKKDAKDTHQHDGLDPHIWLDPTLVKIQVAHIRDGLTRIDPANAQKYAANTTAFLAELEQLDQDIRTIVATVPKNQSTFLVFHPSWGYFARAYGLIQMPIEIEGKEPSPKDLGHIIAVGKKTGSKVIFVQPQFSEKSAAVIAKEIGATVVRLDPLAENWIENMRRAAHSFAEALR